MHEPRNFEPDQRGKWARRAISIPVYLVLTVVVMATLPVILGLAGIRDLIQRTRWASVRVILFLAWYLFCEMWGVAISILFWLGSWLPGVTREKFLHWNFRLQGLWTRALFAGGRTLFGFRVHTENLDCGRTGPYLLFVRHASVADTVLASAYLSVPFSMCLRYVMKRELLWDPCLDIVGNRLPNVFVRRGSSDSQKEIDQVRQLADNLGIQDGVLIYPEGTRFTPQKKQQLLEKFQEKGEEEAHRYALSLGSVLPPRLGGPLALLAAVPDVDVVFFVHTGFEHIRTFWDLWNGRLIQQDIHIALWRVSAKDIPISSEQRKEWLLREWKKVSDWVDAVGKAPDSLS